MTMGAMFGKRTWIGFGVTVTVMLLSLLLGALLAVRGILSVKSIAMWIGVTYAVAAFFGGRTAAGKGMHICALLPAMLLYVLVWVLALSCECGIDFAQHGVLYTVLLLAGALAAYMSCGGKRKGHRTKTAKRPVPRGKRR